MLKVHFKELDSSPKTELTLYDSINRIPFSLKIGNNSVSYETIYTRTLKNENFIEIRFDKISKSLKEITLVSFLNESIKSVETEEMDKRINKFYSCFLNEPDSRLEDSLSTKILRYKTSFCIDWELTKQSEVKYFPLSNNCLIGITSDSYLTSVTLKNLKSEDIFNIFGL